MNPKVLYEDNHLLAVDKPFGMPAQGDETGDLSCLDWAKQYIKDKYNKPGEVFLGLLHRLDRPVGGVILFARTSKAASRMSEMFRTRTIRKSYLAVTVAIPNPKSGELRHFLKKLPDKNIMKAYQKFQHASQEAVTRFEVLETQDDFALVRVSPETGRRHQIRVQMAAAGCGVVGDKKYAVTDFLPDKSIALLARKLEFPHPVKKEESIRIIADYPKGYPWELFREPLT